MGELAIGCGRRSYDKQADNQRSAVNIAKYCNGRLNALPCLEPWASTATDLPPDNSTRIERQAPNVDLSQTQSVEGRTQAKGHGWTRSLLLQVTA